MRITFVISTLEGGGAERVVSNMARYWAAKNWEITILTLFHGHRPVCYDLHPNVTHRDLTTSGLFKNPKPDAQSLFALRDLFNVLTPSERKVFLRDIGLIVALRHAILSTKPQAVISFIDVTNIYVLLSLFRVKLPIIISERCHPVSTGDYGWDRLRRRLYPRATSLVVLAEESLSWFDDEVRDRGRVIPNAVLPPIYLGETENAAQEKRERTLLAMGRLAYEKGFDLLLQAFARVAPRHPSWCLNIFGHGPLQTELEGLANQLGVKERVRFLGFTHQPYDVMRQSDLFVLSSRLEGFPNVLLEAMACGLPVISLDCTTGPRHIIRDGIDGLLAPAFDMTALAEALDRLMGDEAERRRLADRAPEVIERFNMERVMGMWEKLVGDCTGN
jgi:GalNAc-alpha-(1->4)-GalNAc-alpha-(1->3)-diNAcBac-PP-undecaprenol alpha-1,4-N-acetyl-D-galactosaminyltransferase